MPCCNWFDVEPAPKSRCKRLKLAAHNALLSPSTVILSEAEGFAVAFAAAECG
jgi:hypothetical protein